MKPAAYVYYRDEAVTLWCDATWNPVVGCTKVSQGCKNCYAKTLHDQRHRAILAGKAGLAPQYAKPFEVVQVMDDRFLDPLRWRAPRRVFVNSVSDLFHEDIPEDRIVELFGIMALASRHTFQILTKRPERQRSILASLNIMDVLVAARLAFARLGAPQRYPDLLHRRLREGPYDWPLPNVWLGTSTENQEAADERIPALISTPAAVRFLSCEPLLGPIDLSPYMGVAPSITGESTMRFSDLDWIIVGGESGPKGRPCRVEWIESIAEACVAVGVPVFVKQLGAVPTVRNTPLNLRDKKGGDPSEWPEHVRVREFPADVPT